MCGNYSAGILQINPWTFENKAFKNPWTFGSCAVKIHLNPRIFLNTIPEWLRILQLSSNQSQEMKLESLTVTGQEVWAYSQYIYIFLSATKNAQQSEPTDHSDSGPRQLSQLATTSTRWSQSRDHNGFTVILLADQTRKSCLLVGHQVSPQRLVWWFYITGMFLILTTPHN